MADKSDKPEFVDTIGDATAQRYRRVMPRVNKAPVAKDAPKMSNWPPERLEQWRAMERTLDEKARKIADESRPPAGGPPIHGAARTRISGWA